MRRRSRLSNDRDAMQSLRLGLDSLAEEIAKTIKRPPDDPTTIELLNKLADDLRAVSSSLPQDSEVSLAARGCVKAIVEVLYPPAPGDPIIDIVGP